MVGWFVGEGLWCGVFFYGGGIGFVCDIIVLGLFFIVFGEEIDIIVDMFVDCFDVIIIKFGS